MPTPIVIDLSHHNTVPSSFQPAKDAGIIGVIHKATEGTSFKDGKVDAREFMARDVGLLFGLYHFIRPGNISRQVDNFMEVYKRYDSTNLLIVLDYEDEGVSLRDCENWLVGIKGRTGKTPVIYSGHVLKEKVAGGIDPVINGHNYPLWLAQYTASTPSLPKGWDHYWLWQYTEDGEVDGVTPPTDLNAGSIEMVKAYWMDKQPEPEPTPDHLARENAKLRQALEDIRKRADEALL